MSDSWYQRDSYHPDEGADDALIAALGIDVPIAAGDYSPVFSGTIAAAASTRWMYQRIGSIVRVLGLAHITGGPATGDVFVTLPVASTFGAATDATGSAIGESPIFIVGVVGGTPRVEAVGVSIAGATGDYLFDFTYEVLP